MTARLRPRAAIDLPWALAVLAMVAIIWGNSLVPGTGSSEISLAVRDAVRAALDAVGLPSGWVSNYLVRKAGHFIEYALLGALVFRAAAPGIVSRRGLIAPAAAFLVLVPCIDEGIQRAVAGRVGQIPDVGLDCCGAAFGFMIAMLAAHAVAARCREREACSTD